MQIRFGRWSIRQNCLDYYGALQLLKNNANLLILRLVYLHHQRDGHCILLIRGILGRYPGNRGHGQCAVDSSDVMGLRQHQSGCLQKMHFQAPVRNNIGRFILFHAMKERFVPQLVVGKCVLASNGFANLIGDQTGHVRLHLATLELRIDAQVDLRITDETQGPVCVRFPGELQAHYSADPFHCK